MRLVGISLVASFLPALAWAVECRTISDDALRLACYDRQFGAPSTAIPSTPVAAPEETSAGPPAFLSDITLRNELTPSGLGSDPALLSLGRQDGENFSVVRAALTYTPAVLHFPSDNVFGRYGWGPFLSGFYNRNTLTAKRADSRGVNGGFSGTIGEIDVLGFALKTNLAFGRKVDKVAGVTSNTTSFDNIVVSDYLRSGKPYSSRLGWYVFPRLGYFHEDRREVKADQPTGKSNAVYGGLRIDTYPGMISDRLRVSGYVQRFVDTSADAGIQKRHETLYKVSIDYLLYSPREQEWLQPSIGLERNVGGDPLNGIPRSGVTQLSLRLQLN